MGKYFSVSELTRSNTAIANGIENIPNEEQTENINYLIDDVLDIIREAWGAPIYVNSGFRSKELNELVGGVPTSQHANGQAADITTKSDTNNRKLFSLILDLKERGKIDFDQLIDERNYSWIHISYINVSDPNRGEVLHL